MTNTRYGLHSGIVKAKEFQFTGGAVKCMFFLNAGAPTNGTSGTRAGSAYPGSLLIDTTNKKLYINTNTKASPTWTVVGAQTA